MVNFVVSDSVPLLAGGLATGSAHFWIFVKEL
jgi:hypothetical protein